MSVRKAFEVSKAPYRIFDPVGPVPSTASSYAVPYLSLDETRLATRSAYFGVICYNGNISLSRAVFFVATGLFALSVSGDGKPLLRAGTPGVTSFFQDILYIPYRPDDHLADEAQLVPVHPPGPHLATK